MIPYEIDGLEMENIQKRLLSLTTLSLEKALEISVAMEMVAKDAVELQWENREVDVQQVQQDCRQNWPNLNKQKRQQTQSCFRCGDFRHSPNNRKIKNVDCHGCGKRGHIKRACLSGKLRGGRVSGSRNTRNVHNVGKEEQSSEEDISDSEYEVRYLRVNSIQSEKSDPLIIQLKINNKNVKMAIDTGSEISVISKNKILKGSLARRNLIKWIQQRLY